MKDNLYRAGQKLRSANADLANGRVWEAYVTYTDVLESDAPGHPYAFLNRALALILLGHPALATFDCWRAILGGKWAESGPEANFLGRYIKRYVAMYVHALASNDPWTRGCANGEEAGEDGRWLAQPLADFQVRKATKPRRSKGDFPHARYIIMCGYYRLAYALFKCGGGAIQSALNMINIATEQHCETKDQQGYFKDLHNHILGHMQAKLEEDDTYMKTLHDKGLIDLPRDRRMMEDNLFRGLMKSTFTTITREQYPWDNHSVTTNNFDELRPELEQFVQDTAPHLGLGAILSKHQHHTVKGKVPKLILKAQPKEVETPPVAFDDDKGFFVWSKRTGHDDIQCEGCGALLNVDGDWIPPEHPADRLSRSNVAGTTASTPSTLRSGEPSVEPSGSGETASPPAEAFEGRLESPRNPPEDHNPMQALRDFMRDHFPEEVLPELRAPPETQTERENLDDPRFALDDIRPLNPTPLDGRNVSEEQQLEAPSAGGDTVQDPEADRKDSLNPHVTNEDPSLVCPPSPRPDSNPHMDENTPLVCPPSPRLESKPLPPLPSARHERAPGDSQETMDEQEPRSVSIPKLREMMAELCQESESDLRTCLGTRCCVFYCSQQCEENHALAHDNVCDLGIDGTLPSIEMEQYSKIGGWWGGMVPTIPRQRIAVLMLRRIITKLWEECGCQKGDTDEEEVERTREDQAGIPLQKPWVRLMDGNLDEPLPLPERDVETGEVPFVNDIPDGDLEFLFPGYQGGTASPSPEDQAQFKSHKLPFSLDGSVIWPLQVLYNMGGFVTVFDVRRWDGWMLTTLAAKIEAATRVEHFVRFAKIIDANGMIKETRCIDLPSAVRTHGLQKLQTGTPGASSDRFTDPRLANETELLVGSLHPLASLVRVASDVGEQPTVRLVERSGDLFVFAWPVGTKLESGTPLLAADNVVWPFKLLGDLLEPDEIAGIGGRWTSIMPETVARWVRRGYETSNQNDPERRVGEGAGETVEDLLAKYRNMAIGRRRGGAASRRSPRDSLLERSDGQEADDERDDGEDQEWEGDEVEEPAEWEDDEEFERKAREAGGRTSLEPVPMPMELDGHHDATMPVSILPVSIRGNQQSRRHHPGGDGAGIPVYPAVYKEPIPPSDDGPPSHASASVPAPDPHSADYDASADEGAHSDDEEVARLIRSEQELRRINQTLWQTMGHRIRSSDEDEVSGESSDEAEEEEADEDQEQQQDGDAAADYSSTIDDDDEQEEDQEDSPGHVAADSSSTIQGDEVDGDGSQGEGGGSGSAPASDKDTGDGDEDADGKKEGGGGGDSSSPPWTRPATTEELLDISRLSMLDLGH